MLLQTWLRKISTVFAGEAVRIPHLELSVLIALHDRTGSDIAIPVAGDAIAQEFRSQEGRALDATLRILERKRMVRIIWSGGAPALINLTRRGVRVVNDSTHAPHTSRHPGHA